MGSKNRIANQILPIILKDRNENQCYIEPFVGGANIIDKVDGNRIGGDKNKYLIEMWKGLQLKKERPHTITKGMYSKARVDYRNNKNESYSDFLIGWIGWMGSFNGRFFDGGYSGHSTGKTKRDYIAEQIRNTEKQIDSVKGVEFIHSSYETLYVPPNSIIYCDPPYKNTKQYDVSKNFDYEKFWNWVKEMSLKGHKVYVSEYIAPSDFQCLWQKQITNSMNQTKTTKPVEKLFTYKNKGMK